MVEPDSQGIQYVHGASADLTFSNGATSTGTTLLQITAPSAIGVQGVSIPQNGNCICGWYSHDKWKYCRSYQRDIVL